MIFVDFSKWDYVNFYLKLICVILQNILNNLNNIKIITDLKLIVILNFKLPKSWIKSILFFLYNNILRHYNLDRGDSILSVLCKASINIIFSLLQCTARGGAISPSSGTCNRYWQKTLFKQREVGKQ